jgi:hypothetical protein
MASLIPLLPLFTIYRSPFTAFYGAGNGIRTRDPNLGKVVLYQLSYSRIFQGPKTVSGQPLTYLHRMGYNDKM